MKKLCYFLIRIFYTMSRWVVVFFVRYHGAYYVNTQKQVCFNFFKLKIDGENKDITKVLEVIWINMSFPT